ncbi:MAG: hypothetical protein QM808_14705 [Steroidobacteraceae bacterium]
MNSFKGIEIVAQGSRPANLKSGEKYQTEHGFTAIKDGIKASAGASSFVPGRKPQWLRAPMPAGGGVQFGS